MGRVSTRESKNWGGFTGNLAAKRRKAPIVNSQIDEFIAKHTNDAIDALMFGE